MNTPTPRTDEWLAEEKRNPRISGLGNWLDYCKILERELTAVTEQRDGLAEECAKIRDVAERAINYLDQSYRDGFSDEVSELRYELAAVKGGSDE